MLRDTLLGTLTILLFSSQFSSTSTAQAKTEPMQPYPAASDITFQWIYSCPTSKGCAFSCPGLEEQAT
jgi:hypothetical protein